MLGVISQMRIALLDVYQVTSIDCVAYMDFYTPYWLTTSLTLLILVVAFGLHRLLPSIVAACFPDMKRDRVRDLRSMIVKYLLIFMYVLLVLYLFFGRELF
jgi:amino acid permease